MQLAIHVRNLLHLAQPVNVVFLPFSISIVVMIIQKKKNCADGVGGYCAGDKKKKKRKTVMPFSVCTERACGKTVPSFPTIFFFFTES